MKYQTAAAVVLGLASTTAHAGGLDRSGQSITAIFEQGRYAEFSFGSISPETSGAAVAPLGGFDSGDLTPSFLQLGAAYKADINDQWSYAFIYDQPFGADVAYPAGTGYFAGGSTAELDVHALTGILRYRMPNNLSFHAGLRVQSAAAEAAVPFVAGYTAVGDRDVAVGYLAGVAYERPDIALRVSLTYNSAISHDLDTTESTLTTGVVNSVTEFETPQSVNLEFQTGVAADTLVFGGVRWTDWSESHITPIVYQGATGGSLVSYDDDVYSYSLGVGRKLNETWSVAASLGYEKSNGGFQSNLGPTDGIKSINLAAIYSKDNMKITSGIRYVKIGDAQTELGGVASPAASFDDNSAVAFGVKVGFSF
ncbi:MAG: OmpP1/FadL family transporter [Sulfitobacter sp.]